MSQPIDSDRPLGPHRLVGSSERGSHSIFVVFPLALLALFGSVHAALVFHGRSVVAAAAQDGLAAAQIETGTADDGHAAALGTLSLSPRLGGPNVQVTLGNGGDTITVRVRARVTSTLLPFFNDVSAVVSGPKERFYDQTER